MSVLKIEALYTVDDNMPDGECAELIDGQTK